MPANAIVNSQQSQVVASAAQTGGTSVAINGVSLVPRLGQSQIIRISLLVDGTTTVLVDLTFFDAAFEEFGEFGERKKKGDTQGGI
jgi:hypothetical protein